MTVRHLRTLSFKKKFRTVRSCKFFALGQLMSNSVFVMRKRFNIIAVLVETSNCTVIRYKMICCLIAICRNLDKCLARSRNKLKHFIALVLSLTPPALFNCFVGKLWHSFQIQFKVKDYSNRLPLKWNFAIPNTLFWVFLGGCSHWGVSARIGVKKGWKEKIVSHLRLFRFFFVPKNRWIGRRWSLQVWTERAQLRLRLRLDLKTQQAILRLDESLAGQRFTTSARTSLKKRPQSTDRGKTIQQVFQVTDLLCCVPISVKTCPWT